jgi:hypothetical protein
MKLRRRENLRYLDEHILHAREPCEDMKPVPEASTPRRHDELFSYQQKY